MPKISKGLKQAIQLQDFAFNAAMAVKRSLEAEDESKMKITREDSVAICNLIKSWESCQERVRIHKGKPLPGSRRPVPEKSKRGGWNEPAPAAASPKERPTRSPGWEYEASCPQPGPQPEPAPAPGDLHLNLVDTPTGSVRRNSENVN